MLKGKIAERESRPWTVFTPEQAKGSMLVMSDSDSFTLILNVTYDNCYLYI